ncbi:PBECR4 domain-containing protein [Paenibacillus vandeheii]
MLERISSVQELHALTAKPRIDQINMKLILDYYLTYLFPYRFTYYLEDGSILHLDFNKENFCHLVGTESIVKKAIKDRAVHARYKGIQGFNRIMNGEITFEDLKKKNPGGFKSVKSKLVNFHFIPMLLLSSTQVVYYTRPINSINCALLIFDVYQNAYIHLGIDKIAEGTYVARTFLIEPITLKNPGTTFIDGQKGPIPIVRTIKTPKPDTYSATSNLSTSPPSDNH